MRLSGSEFLCERRSHAGYACLVIWRPALATTALATLALFFGLTSCDDELDCENGECRCLAGDECNLTCDAPPCHVVCEEDSSCSGACANGNCTCEAGADCDFTCDAPPCHVTCEGDNPSCSGTCANGTCKCGPNSTCTFECAAGPCHANCEGACLVTCPPETAGTQNCDISQCGLGEVVVCPGGGATACGVPCPS